MGVSSLRSFRIVGDGEAPGTYIGRLDAGEDIEDHSRCMIGLDGSWVWLTDSLSSDHDACLAVEPDWHSPIATGELLYLLPQPFSPRLAFILLDTSRDWQRREFISCLAASSQVIGTDGKSWRKLRRIDSENEIKPSETIVREGWDHEHCDVCNKHIYVSVPYFTHEEHDSRYFLCEFCYERFAKGHVIDEVIYPGRRPREGEHD